MADPPPAATGRSPAGRSPAGRSLLKRAVIGVAALLTVIWLVLLVRLISGLL